MTGIYTEIAKKRAEQSKAQGNRGSAPSLLPQPTVQAAPATEETVKTRKQGNKETRKQGTMAPVPTEPQEFDLNIEPYKKGTFIFTYEELDAVDDLKKQLKRRMDLPATQYDIVRAAIHIITEDYRTHGAGGAVQAKGQGVCHVP